MYPDVMKEQIDTLNSNLGTLNTSIKDFSKTSDDMQKKLVFWTKVMAGAIVVQAIGIGFQIYLAF